MYRLLGDNHTLGGLPFAAQVFLRALDGVRNRLADQADLSGNQLRALSGIAEQSGLDPDTLAGSLELEPDAARALVAALASRGLVAGADDGQAVPGYVLTPQGHELVTALYESFQTSISDAASTLGDERLWALASGMLKMARKLDYENAASLRA